MLLHLSTWQEIEDYLKRSKTVVIPIGSNEQHGPAGLLGTDWLCPEIIAHEAQKTSDLLVAPTFNIGMAQHHLGFPGTIALRPSTFMAAIGDWCRSLGLAGFEKLYFLNGHGGNVATIDAAFSELYAEATYSQRNRGFACKQKNWWELKGVLGLANRQFPTGHGSHATPSEIAVTQWGYPDAIKSANYAPQIAPTGPIREALDFRARYPDGRMGSDPGQATPDKGGELVKTAVAGLIEDVAAFSNEAMPRPGLGGEHLARPHLHRPRRQPFTHAGCGHAPAVQAEQRPMPRAEDVVAAPRQVAVVEAQRPAGMGRTGRRSPAASRPSAPRSPRTAACRPGSGSPWSRGRRSRRARRGEPRRRPGRIVLRAIQRWP